MFFDDDGDGNLRIYYLVSGTKTYYLAVAGTVNYVTGSISVSPIYITSVSNVDGNSSTDIRMTATPNSTDIVGKRNQILEIDTLNTTITGGQDIIAAGSGSATYTTTSSYVAPSSY
jgi:Trk K+ transport system NAD-binding subunit